MAELIVGKFVGSGGYGNVYQARWEGRKVAIKKFPLAQDEVDRAGAAIQHEVNMLQRLTDRHIIQFYGSIYHEGKLVLIMDYAEGGSLQRAIEAGELTTAGWLTKKRIAQEIASGLAYIHHKQVLHRDLKSMNVLLTRHMEVKLCDFGLAIVKVRSSSLSKSNEASFSSLPLKGTFRWMAPELLEARPRYSTKSDMYALGMVLWEMAANRTVPFREQPDNFMVMALVKGGEREVLPEDTPADYCQWVKRCWEQDPAKRPEAHELVAYEDDEDKDQDHAQEKRHRVSAVSVTQSMSGIARSPPSSGNPRETSGLARHATTGGEMDQLLASANGGDVQAQMSLATRYEEGIHVEQSDTQAFKWYLRAAAHDHPEAQYKVGYLFHTGRGTQQNHVVALYWLGLAAAKDYPPAQTYLGQIYSSDNGLDGIEKDHSKALDWYKKAAEKGDVSAQYSLGSMFYHGLGVEQDCVEAALWYLKSAEQGDARAQSALGGMCEEGLGIERDHGQAFLWYRKAADQGNTTALVRLAWMYQNGCGVDRDSAEALSCYTKAAEQGNLAALHRLSWMYQNGIEVEQDHAQAAYWFRKAAEKGDMTGQCNLGVMYYAGTGVEQDYAEAAVWFRKAAEQGDEIAQVRLGTMYEKGLGMERNYHEAHAWYLKAAEKGDEEAQYRLGMMYQHGRGIHKSITQAIVWHRKAADQGDARAKMQLTALEKAKDTTIRRFFSLR